MPVQWTVGDLWRANIGRGIRRVVLLNRMDVPVWSLRGKVLWDWCSFLQTVHRLVEVCKNALCDRVSIVQSIKGHAYDLGGALAAPRSQD